MTPVARSAVAGGADIRIQLLHSAGCPHVAGLRAALDRCLVRSGLRAHIEDLQGPYPSPTLLVNGRDVMGRVIGPGPSCRLDLPGEEQILTALHRASHEETAPWASPALPKGPEKPR